MFIYTTVMFVTGALFFWIGTAVSKGHTRLIHDYHQKNIAEKDLPAYGKAFSVGMYIMSASLVLSGVISLLGESKMIVILSVAVLFLGFIVSFFVLAKVQKKYNGGFF